MLNFLHILVHVDLIQLNHVLIDHDYLQLVLIVFLIQNFHDFEFVFVVVIVQYHHLIFLYHDHLQLLYLQI
jgi:hypothetical protein